MTTTLRRLALVGLTCTSLWVLPTATASGKPKTFSTGFYDIPVMGLETGERATWLQRAQRVGASDFRIQVNWFAVAPTQPGPGEASDPQWAGYRFAPLDGQVRAALAANLRPIISVSGAPRWAQGPNPATSNREGKSSWMPDAAAFGQFMRATAKRYDGTTPDPADATQRLPAVRTYQVWNEPNLNLYLSPQYDKEGRPFAAVRFRDLVNAAYDNIKQVNPSATVAAGGLAPYGDPPTRGYRTRPVEFLRSMLCINDKLEPACNVRTRVDAISLHPYAIDRPARPAVDPDDATIPDWNRLTTVLRAARRAKTVGPRYPQQWVTEISYDSSPPDPDGVPVAKRGRYIAQTLYLFWKQGVDKAIWFGIRDQDPTPNYASTYQSGMYTLDGTEKADAAAFRFPAWIKRKTGRDMVVWWRSPAAGQARVQVRRDGSWKTVERTTARVNGVRVSKVPRRRVTAVRVRMARGVVSYVLEVR